MGAHVKVPGRLREGTLALHEMLVARLPGRCWLSLVPCEVQGWWAGSSTEMTEPAPVLWRGEQSLPWRAGRAGAGCRSPDFIWEYSCHLLHPEATPPTPASLLLKAWFTFLFLSDLRLPSKINF